MRRLIPVFVLAAIVAVVVVITLNKNKIPDAPAPPAVTKEETNQPSNVVAKPQTNETVESTETPEPTEEVAAANEPVTDANWDQKLNDLLGDSAIDENVKADKIADMIVSVTSPQAQEEMAGHLINLTPDDGYAKAAEILKNEKYPGAVTKILLDDLFNRDHGLMLPLVLDVAKNQNHPLKGEAKEMLEMVIQEDHGDNWEDWSKAVDKQLKGDGQ